MLVFGMSFMVEIALSLTVLFVLIAVCRDGARTHLLLLSIN